MYAERGRNDSNRLGIGMANPLDIMTSVGATLARLGVGMNAQEPSSRPRRPLQLYEFEACPFCRRVREALSELDLSASIYPCPKGGTRYRPQVVREGGLEQFPYLIDPDAGVRMYESADIVAYLFDTYGGRRPGPLLGWTSLAVPGSMLASAWRPLRGGNARPAVAPKVPLELYSFEASPFCRLVRETLCELELPYMLHNVAKGSSGREAFVARSGRMMVPYLVDPNTGREMFESADICTYLGDTYGTAA